MIVPAPNAEAGMIISLDRILPNAEADTTLNWGLHFTFGLSMCRFWTHYIFYIPDLFSFIKSTISCVVISAVI